MALGSNKRKMLVVMLLLLAVTFSAGCVSQPATTIKSQEDVQKTLPNITKNIDDIGSTLADLDNKLG